MGNAAQHCRLGLFEDSDFAGDLEDSKSATGGLLCIFGSRTFVAISWDVQEANVSITQLYRIRDHIVGCWVACGRLLALDLWGTTPRIPTRTRACTWETGAKTQSTPKTKQVSDQNVDLSHIDRVPSNALLSEKESQLYIFEDNEAGIKMLIKGRSPTMRHVSRTH